MVEELLKRLEMEKLVHVHCRDLKVSQACGDHAVNACGPLPEKEVLEFWPHEQVELNLGSHTLWMAADLSHCVACSL